MRYLSRRVRCFHHHSASACFLFLISHNICSPSFYPQNQSSLFPPDSVVLLSGRENFREGDQQSSFRVSKFGAYLTKVLRNLLIVSAFGTVLVSERRRYER